MWDKWLELRRFSSFELLVVQKSDFDILVHFRLMKKFWLIRSFKSGFECRVLNETISCYGELYE